MKPIHLTLLLISIFHSISSYSQQYEWEQVGDISNSQNKDREDWITGSRLAFDGEKIILFGGIHRGDNGQYGGPASGETWFWDKDKWVHLISNNETARFNHNMIYDELRKKVVLFGGGHFDQIWEWNRHQNNWKLASQISSITSINGGMCYDSKRKIIVIFGGINNTLNINSTFEWNGTEWKTIKTNHFPSPRSAHSIIYDQNRNKVVLYGGTSPNLQTSNPYDSILYYDTWEYDGFDWTKIETNAPTVSSYHSMVYDPINNQTLLFGGRGKNSFSNTIWKFKDSIWKEDDFGEIKPIPRDLPSMVYDPINKNFMIYGGRRSGTTDFLFDTWILKIKSSSVKDRIWKSMQ